MAMRCKYQQKQL
jgi:hypothetical protein